METLDTMETFDTMETLDTMKELSSLSKSLMIRLLMNLITVCLKSELLYEPRLVYTLLDAGYGPSQVDAIVKLKEEEKRAQKIVELEEIKAIISEYTEYDAVAIYEGEIAVPEISDVELLTHHKAKLALCKIYTLYQIIGVLRIALRVRNFASGLNDIRNQCYAKFKTWGRNTFKLFLERELTEMVGRVSAGIRSCGTIPGLSEKDSNAIAQEATWSAFTKLKHNVPAFVLIEEMSVLSRVLGFTVLYPVHVAEHIVEQDDEQDDELDDELSFL
jgi:hypothetical protein